MFQAIGRAAQKNADGTFTVKVEFLDERTGKTIRVQSFTTGTIAGLKGAIDVELQGLKQAEQDVTLNKAIVDVVLGEV